MDVDQPVFTQISRACTQIKKAYTDDDKRKHRNEGRCFQCSRIGHMAKDCPMKKTSATQFSRNTQFNRNKPFSNWRTTTRKYNKPFKKHTFSTPTRFGQPSTSYARSTQIEEVDNKLTDDKEVYTLAACTNKLDEGQREQWVQEMKSLGINF